jgi:putative MATE family efflux protein
MKIIFKVVLIRRSLCYIIEGKIMKDLTKGNVIKVLLIFAIPLIISGLLSQTYNLFDLMVAGKFVGDNALGATGCSTTFIQFVSSLFWGFGVAVATITGELYGEKSYKRIVTATKTVLILNSAVMFLVCLFCIIFARQILTLLQVDEVVFEDAMTYFIIYFIALFFQSIYYQIVCILQSLGNSKYPLLVTVVTSIANLGLNLLFVLVFKLGVFGLAIATLISGIIGFILGFIKILKTIKELGGDFKLEFSKEELNLLLKIGIPCILQQSALYLSSVVVQPVVNGLGKDVSAGYSVAMNINLLLNAIYHSISRTVATYTSQSKGARLYNNFSRGIKVGMLLQVLFCAPLCILIAIFPNEISSVFLNTKDSACLPYATQYVVLCIPFTIFVSYGNLMHSFYKSVEAVKTVFVSTLIFTIARITFTYVIPNQNYLFSVYLGLSLAWVVEAIVLTIIYFSGIWKSKEQKEFENKSKNA